MTVKTEGRHAAEFVLSEASGTRSRGTAIIESGAGVIAPGTVLGAKSTGKMVPSPVATTDGAEAAVAVALYGCDATSADQTISIISRDAEVNQKLLTFAADVDTDPEIVAKVAELAAVGIVARD